MLDIEKNLHLISNILQQVMIVYWYGQYALISALINLANVFSQNWALCPIIDMLVEHIEPK